MNKFLTKIATFSVGLAMAIGVGVAVGSNNIITKVDAANVTSAANIVNGTAYYLQSYDTSKTFYLGFTDTASNNNVTGSKQTSTSNAIAITFVKTNTDNVWNLRTPNGNYLSPSSSNGKLKVTSDAVNVTASTVGNYVRLTVTINSTEWSIQGNNANNTTAFGGYKNTQNDLILVEKPVLSSITLSGNYKTSFDNTESFSFGGTVTANYTDSTTANVTAKATFSGYDISTPGNQTVTVSYTEANVTKTTTYNITVTESVVYTAESLRIEDESLIKKSYIDGEDWDNSTFVVQLVKGGNDNPKTYQYVTLTQNLTFVYKNSLSETLAKPVTANSVTLTITSSDYSTLPAFVSASFNVTVTDYEGTYNITSKATAYDGSVTADSFKTKTNNSSIFTISLNKVRLYCTPGAQSGDIATTADIVLSASDATLTLTAPTGYYITRAEINASTKGDSVGTITLGTTQASNVVNSARTLVVDHPFASAVTISTSHWIYMEYIKLNVTKISNVSSMATAYGIAFNDLTHSECAALSGISAATWTKAEAIYGLAVTANDSVENTLKTAERSEEGNDLEQAMFRYDLIVYKYTKSNFLGRTVSNPLGLNAHIGFDLNDRVESNSLIITLIVSLIGVTAIGGYLFMRKRKEIK